MPTNIKATADEIIGMLKGRSYRYGQVHHTYNPNHGDFNGSNHIALQNGMNRYHRNVRGWYDIGQHLTIFPDGMCVTGRRFSETPYGIAGYNTGSFMIEHVGNFDKGQDRLEGAQLEASIKIYNYLINHCGASIIFHREHAAKSCPGTDISKKKFVKAVRKNRVINVHKSRQSNSNVKTLQKNLKKLGHDPGEIDGFMGPNTRSAIKSLQRAENLQVDGSAGPETKGKIKDLLNGGLTVSQYKKLNKKIKQLDKKMNRKMNKTPTKSNPGDDHEAGWDFLVEHGLSDGSDPFGHLSRQQFATLLKRFYDKETLLPDYMQDEIAGNLNKIAPNLDKPERWKEKLQNHEMTAAEMVGVYALGNMGKEEEKAPTEKK